MTENIFGSPNKNSNVWVYNGNAGGVVLAPFGGTHDNIDNDGYIYLLYSKGKCNFYAKIGPLTDVVGNSKDEDAELGKAKTDTVRLTILKDKNSNTALDPKDYFDKKNDCFKEDKKDSTTATAAAVGSAAVATKSNASYNPYRVAAAPFDVMQGGIKTVGKIFVKEGELERINEEVERIKQLMK